MNIYLVEQDNIGMEDQRGFSCLSEAVIVAESPNNAKAAAVDVCAAFSYRIEVPKLTVTMIGEYNNNLKKSQYRWTSKYGNVLAVSCGPGE